VIFKPNIPGPFICFALNRSKEELELLPEFDAALNNTIDKTPQDLPVIEEFIKTEE